MDTYRAEICEKLAAKTGRKWVRWTKKKRQAFLDHLAATCNVASAAALIGVHTSSVHALRRREPAFAQGWAEALALGYEMLETRLLGHALAGNDAAVIADDAGGAGPVAVELALRLLTVHRRAPNKPNRGGPPRRYADPDDTDKVLLARLDAIEKRRRAAGLMPAPASVLIEHAPQPATTGEER